MSVSPYGGTKSSILRGKGGSILYIFSSGHYLNTPNPSINIVRRLRLVSWSTYEIIGKRNISWVLVIFGSQGWEGEGER